VIIVSDTSPINNLAAIGHLHLLQALYGHIIIPEAVYQELTSPNFPVAGSIEVQTSEWIKTQAVTNQALLTSLGEELDPGEAAAIVLANERRGRLIADRFELSYTGILGILIEAKHQGLIPAVKPLLNALINQAGFWIAAPLYERILQVVEES
jgi:predicted nucleic acid-binding protein